MADQLFADRYRLEHRLGVGGMSTVQLAFDTRLERYVAVKLLAEHLAEDKSFVARFRREALAAARLVHPNVVQVFDFGLDEETGRNFIVMEHVDGQSCAEILRDQGALPARRGGLDPRPGLPRPRLRAPQRRRAPRRQAGQPAAQPRGRGQARRLRHRQGGRGLRDHEGRLGARHRRLPLTRAGARREGRAAGRPLRARGRLLPAAHRPPALRGGLADRPRPPAGGRARRCRRATSTRTSRARSARPSCARCTRCPRAATRARSRWPTRSATACAASRPTPPTPPSRSTPRSATRMLGDADRRHARRDAPPAPSAPAARSSRSTSRPAAARPPRAAARRAAAARSAARKKRNPFRAVFALVLLLGVVVLGVLGYQAVQDTTARAVQLREDVRGTCRTRSRRSRG